MCISSEPCGNRLFMPLILPTSVNYVFFVIFVFWDSMPADLGSNLCCIPAKIQLDWTPFLLVWLTSLCACISLHFIWGSPSTSMNWNWGCSVRTKTTLVFSLGLSWNKIHKTSLWKCLDWWREEGWKNAFSSSSGLINGFIVCTDFVKKPYGLRKTKRKWLMLGIWFNRGP